MRTRFLRLLLVGLLVLPTYAAAQGVQCDDICADISGGSWLLGSLHSWCLIIRTPLCAIGY
jgi:hypothetical protein